MKKISNIISLLTALFLLIVSAFVFKCPPMENGSYMNCHKSNVTVAIISCVIIILELILFFGKSRMVSIISSVFILLAAAISAFVPGVIIKLCMMPEMTCRAIFRPVDIICSLIIIIFATIGLRVVKKEA